MTNKLLTTKKLFKVKFLHQEFESFEDKNLKFSVWSKLPVLVQQLLS